MTITTAHILRQDIFIDWRFTPKPTQYLIDPLHLIQSGLHLLDDLHVSLLHVFSLPFLSLLITALHLEIRREKISSNIFNAWMYFLSFFRHGHEIWYILPEWPFPFLLPFHVYAWLPSRSFWLSILPSDGQVLWSCYSMSFHKWKKKGVKIIRFIWQQLRVPLKYHYLLKIFFFLLINTTFNCNK